MTNENGFSQDRLDQEDNSSQEQISPQQEELNDSAELLEDDQSTPVEPDIETEMNAEDQNETDTEEETDEEIDEPSEDEDIEVTVESVIESVLIASDEPLTVQRLANIAESDSTQVRQHLKTLNEKYRQNNHSFRIEKIAGGFQLMTLPQYNHWLKKLLRTRSDSKLSPAALETLAIVAYKQPVTRADVEAIRGVSVGEVIRSLMYKGLVKIVGRADIVGRPMLHGTTKKFLEVFGLNTLKDLPKIEELKKPQD